MNKFEELGLSAESAKTLENLHIKEPTEIQQKAIPVALEGKDIIGASATGSGKTLAFGAAIIEKAEHGKGIQALILTPTRELAEQINKSLGGFSRHKRLNLCVIYGGVGIGPQMRELERADIVVGTPGRILDHLTRGTINLTGIKTLVLDEADRMLDMGFIDDVEKIISRCPKKRQTLLFSATISPDIEHITKRHLHNPVEINVESYIDSSKLKQIFYDVPQNMKFGLLVHLLKKEKDGLVMIFCSTRHNADFVGRNLMNQGFEAIVLHGGLTQDRRNKILQKFHSGKVYALVCTDVAARGLDIPKISHVYNYDLPKNSKEYIHRIGRTARAGKDGIAVNIVSNRDYMNFRNILRDDELKIEQEELPYIPRVELGGRGDGGREGRREQGDRRDGGSGRGEGYRGRRNDSRGGDRSEGRRHSSGSRDSRNRSSSRRRY